MKRARIICIEGTEGVGKTTQVEQLSNYLKNKGFSVLTTKEPGTPLAPITMELRNFMLNQQFNSQLTSLARELISQTIRSIHLEKVIRPAIDEYDFIIQDRGLLSGLAYGVACGHDIQHLLILATMTIQQAGFTTIDSLYDDIVYLVGDPVDNLNRAIRCKQEFNAGDVIEAKGAKFINNVSKIMREYSAMFKNVHYMDVDDKGISTIHNEMKKRLNL